MKSILVFEDWGNPSVERRMVTGLLRYAVSTGWRLVRIARRGSMEHARAQRMMEHFKPIGCVVGYNEGLPPEVFGETPVVWMDCLASNLPASASLISHDNTATVMASAKELFALGLENYAYVAYPGREPWSETRGRVFAELCEGRGVGHTEIRPPAPPDDMPSMQAFLRERLRALPKPCGIFAVNDAMGAHVLLAAEEEGISVPGEIAVIGVDDDELICETAHPTLSSVLPDWERGGWLCGEALDRLMSGEASEPVRQSFGELGVVRRASTQYAGARPSPRVIDAVEYIRLKSGDGISVGDVVARMGCSRRFAEIHFRRTTGRSIHDEIESARLDRAVALLRQGNVMLGAVASRCGYASATTLREAFRKRFGVSMRDWRKRQ